MTEYRHRRLTADQQPVNAAQLPYAKLLLLAPDLLGPIEPGPDCGEGPVISICPDHLVHKIELAWQQFYSTSLSTKHKR